MKHNKVSCVHWYRLVLVLVLILVVMPVLAGCASTSSNATSATTTAPDPTPATTTAPAATSPTSSEMAGLAPLADPTSTPTPPRTYAPGTFIGGVAVGGLTSSDAEKLLAAKLPMLRQPLELRAGGHRLTLHPDELDLHISLDGIQPGDEQAAHAVQTPWITSYPLSVTLNTDLLRQRLEAFASQTVTTPTLVLLTETDSISRSFVMLPRSSLNVDDALGRVEAALRSPAATRVLTLELHAHPDSPMYQASLAQIMEQVTVMQQAWDGVVGFYLYDMARGESLGLHEQTVFSGASVMKVAILLSAYAHLPEFTEEQQEHVRAMIVESDNLAANHLLAASAGGTGTEDALAGGLQMSQMLQNLGLQHSYMYMPYEAEDYLVSVRGITIRQGPPNEGPPPYTDADPVLRTTPAEISQVFLWIDQCSKGGGPLPAVYTRTITASRCQDMLDLLAQNEDMSRMRAGIPDHVRVEHKSGWIADMQADVGIVRSPGGDYLLALYFYTPVDQLYDPEVLPYLEAFSRMVYTAYNPVVVGGGRVP